LRHYAGLPPSGGVVAQRESGAGQGSGARGLSSG
jgi:hypothetical protein